MCGISFDISRTADIIYSVIGIEHNIKAGEYITKLKMVNMPDAYGQYETLFDKISDALKVLSEAEDE